jgi:hypothetical protein
VLFLEILNVLLLRVSTEIDMTITVLSWGERSFEHFLELGLLSSFILTFDSSDQLTLDFNFTTFSCELQCIWLQVHQHLLDSLFIWLYGKAHHFNWDIFHSLCLRLGFFFHWEAMEACFDLNLLGLSLILLNWDDFINCSLNIEAFDYLSELACFQLCIAKDIFYVEEEQVGWRGLDIVTLDDFKIEEFYLLVDLWLYELFECLYLNDILHAENLNDLTLIQNWVQRVSHFVRYCRVDQAQ